MSDSLSPEQKLTLYLDVPSTCPPSSLTCVDRCIGYHNPNWHCLPKSTRLMYLRVYDISEHLPDPPSV